MAKLRVPSFEVSFDGRRISGPEVVLETGDLVELHGLSSAGCETLLLLLGGLLPCLTRTEPAAGNKIRRTSVRIPAEELPQVSYDGQSLHEMGAERRASTVGFIFGEPELFILGETVWEEFKYSFAAVSRQAPRLKALEDYGLYEKEGFRTETLSCGEQHRLNWACVLELRPPVIMALLQKV